MRLLCIVLKRMAIRPNCLLVYSPTHPSHVNVMVELTKYLRCCYINPMIDIFDIAETVSKVSSHINEDEDVMLCQSHSKEIHN